MIKLLFFEIYFVNPTYEMTSREQWIAARDFDALKSAYRNENEE